MKNWFDILAVAAWLVFIFFLTKDWFLPNLSKINLENDNQITFFVAWYFNKAIKEKNLPLLPIIYEFYPVGLEPFDEPIFLTHTFLTGLLSQIFPLEVVYNILLFCWIISFGIVEYFFISLFTKNKPLAFILSFFIVTPQFKEFLSSAPMWIPLVFIPLTFLIFEKTLREGKGKFLLLLSIILALCFLSNPQYFYYILLSLIFLTILRKKKVFKVLVLNKFYFLLSLLIFFLLASPYLIFLPNVFEIFERGYKTRVWQVITPLECLWVSEGCYPIYPNQFYYFLLTFTLFLLLCLYYVAGIDVSLVRDYLIVSIFFLLYSFTPFALAMNKFFPFSNLLNNPRRSYYLFLCTYPLAWIPLLNLSPKIFRIAFLVILTLVLLNIFISLKIENISPIFLEREKLKLLPSLKPFYFLSTKEPGAIYISSFPKWEPTLLLGSMISGKPLVNGYADYKVINYNPCITFIEEVMTSRNTTCVEYFKKFNIRYWITSSTFDFDLENSTCIIYKKGNLLIIDVFCSLRI